MFPDIRSQSVSGIVAPPLQSGTVDDLGAQITALNALALRSLRDLFSEKDKLFLRSVTLRGNDVRCEESSPKRTLIALLGLNRLTDSAKNSMFDIHAMHEAVFCDTRWVTSLKDLGLLTWFTAECAPERLARLFKEFAFDAALEKYPDGRQAHTVGLAWFLAGISHARLNNSAKLPDLTDPVVDAYHLLLENQGNGGIFGQMGSPRWYQWDLCRRLGNFGDQIYAIYALATFARAFQIEEPLAPALNCAHAIQALQGEKGEWWFLYDKKKDRVVNRYPILSWQQDGTAPVGLLALSEATGQSFHEPIRKGLCLSAGEENVPHGNLIWGSVHPRTKRSQYWEAALSLLNISRPPKQEPLCVYYETRPDHFGWMLYAFGGMGLPAKAASSGAPAGG